ncbi:MAG: class I SAM-dependent methyltransferase [Hyphomicrobiales bacterium]
MTRTAPAERQVWSAEAYDRNARFVSDLGAAVLEWLNPQSGERILDLGCGDGALTRRIAEAGADVVGVDASEDLLGAARAAGIDARFMDGHALTFEHEFDAVFSNAALHWMTRPQEVIEGIVRALRPGGRFVAEFGGHGNVAAIVTAMRAVAWKRTGDQSIAGPWFYPTPDEYREMLEGHGFTVKRAGLFPRPTPLPTGMGGWLMTFRSPFFEQFGAEQDDALGEVVDLLKPALCDSAGGWTADYVRIRVEAQL